MTKVFETYGGSASLTISANTQLSANRRLWVIDPSTSGLAVRLPDARGYPDANVNPGIGTGDILTIANHNASGTDAIEVLVHSGTTFPGGPLSIPHGQLLSFINWDDTTEDGAWMKWPATGTPSFGRAQIGAGQQVFSITVHSLNEEPVDLPVLLTGLGWNGSSTVSVFIHILPTGVLAANTGWANPEPAFDTGSIPGSSQLLILNEGYITGRGGEGGLGGIVSPTVEPGSGTDGGPALRLTIDNVAIDNQGTIQGGGGGGGGGVYNPSWPGAPIPTPAYNGGGGGGGGGHIGGPGGFAVNQGLQLPQEGGTGVLTHAGSGGQPGSFNPTGGGYAGGNPGDAAAGLLPGDGGPYLVLAAGVSAPTWINTGTRLGGVEVET